MSGVLPTDKCKAEFAILREKRAYKFITFKIDATGTMTDNYKCNVWVFCPEKDGCFAPAAGDFVHGQCWLKFQEDPANPHVNMRGEYSAEYRKTHPSAPKSVQWIAGSIVEEGATVTNGTWSSRSHWR